MPRIMEDESIYETWKNSTRSKVVLKRQDRLGNLVDEVIAGGKTFHITPNERRLNQEMAISEDMDVFQNGLLSPVRLIETSEDAEEIRSNPNLISESEMTDLYKTKTIATFRDKVEGISNPVVLQRMLELASSDDVNATVKQVEAVKSHLREIAPSLYSEVEVVSE